MTEPGRAASRLTVRVFGPLEVLVNGASLPHLRSRKGEWLLALLILRHGEEAGGERLAASPLPVERAWLAATLWPDSPEPQALANLRISLTDLRRALGTEAQRLHAPAGRTLSLNLSRATVDVVEFDREIAAHDASGWERAVALYRGPLLEGCAEEWVVQERSHREQAYLAALERLASAAVARGHHAVAESYLRRAVAIDPARETAQRTLMQALAASGNYAAATQVYRELRTRLHRELNAEPDAETRTLFGQLRAQAREKAVRGARDTVRGGEPALSDASRPNVPPTAHGAGGRPIDTRTAHGSEATVTFLFTDIEGSTRLWEEAPERMREALARHDRFLRDVIESHHGHVFKTMGDAFCAAFVAATDAVSAALAIQRALERETAPCSPLPSRPAVTSADVRTDERETGTPLRVRIALHTGIAEVRDGDYSGPAINRVARLLVLAHGGQVLLSGAARELVQDALPPEASMQDMGRHRLRDLQRPERVFQLLHPDLPADFPLLPSLGVLPNNLPQQVTRFVGREAEIAAVKRLLETGAPARRPARLLTLTGPGGTGKTRLALQVAADLLGGERDGVWLVELASLADPMLVPQVVASVLGIREGGRAPATAQGATDHGKAAAQGLVEALKPRTLLLLLDNCEHLLSACAKLADHLLRGCPGVQILATSREALGIAGEQTYRLPSLSLPERPEQVVRPEDLAPYEATQLFIDRAMANRSTFMVTASNAAVVAQICRRLDGIPLAIELAAARVKALPPDQILRRLDDRFRLLTQGSRSALPRQQTLQALIDWSYDLLSEPERALLLLLSVFAGSFTLEAAEAVCAFGAAPGADVFDLLAQLVDKSLVSVEEREGAARYRLLESTREYARGRLNETGEWESMQRRHAAYFLHLGVEAQPFMQGPEEARWLDRLEADHDNLRGALACFLREPGADAESAQRLAGELWHFWWVRGYWTEGRRWLEHALAAGTGRTAARARALETAARLAGAQQDLAACAELAVESRSIHEEVGDRAGVAAILSLQGWLAQRQGDQVRARALLEQSLSLSGQIGDYASVARALNKLGGVAAALGDTATARIFHQQCLALQRTLENKSGTAWALFSLAETAQQERDWHTARSFYANSLRLFQELGLRRAIEAAVWQLAILMETKAMDEARARKAAWLSGATRALREALGESPDAPWYGEAWAEVAGARQLLGDAGFEAAVAEGRLMPLEQVITLALEESGAGG